MAPDLPQAGFPLCCSQSYNLLNCLTTGKLCERSTTAGKACKGWDPIQGRNHTPNPNPSTFWFSACCVRSSVALHYRRPTSNVQLHSSLQTPILPPFCSFSHQKYSNHLAFCRASVVCLIACRLARSSFLPPFPSPHFRAARAVACTPLAPSLPNYSSTSESTVALRKVASSAASSSSVSDTSQ